MLDITVIFANETARRYTLNLKRAWYGFAETETVHAAVTALAAEHPELQGLLEWNYTCFIGTEESYEQAYIPKQASFLKIVSGMPEPAE